MRNLLFLLVALFSLHVSAQETEVIYAEPDYGYLYIVVKSSDKNPVAFESVWLEDKSSKEVLTAVTDKLGKVKFRVFKNKTYSISFSDKKDVLIIPVPQKIPSFLTKTITYDPPKNKTSNNVASVKSADTIFQNFNSSRDLKMNEAGVSIIVRDINSKPIEKLPVGLYCAKINKIFIANTDKQGKAYFVVYPSNQYQIMLEDMTDFQTIGISNGEKQNVVHEIKFSPANIQETKLHDTIKQKLPAVPSASSSRALVHLKMLDEDKFPFKNQNVYINTIPDSLVYTAKTDASGYVNIMLPKGKKYSLHFDVEKNVDVLDLLEKKGIRTLDIEYTYIPLKAISINQALYSSANPIVSENTEIEKSIPNKFLILYNRYSNYKTEKIVKSSEPKESSSDRVLMQALLASNTVTPLHSDIDLQIQFSANKKVASVEKPVNICIVLDQSGSMAGDDKLDEAKKVVVEFVKKLKPNDRLSIVSFDDNYNMVYSSTSTVNKAEATKKLMEVLPRGGTCINNAMKIGYLEVLNRFNTNSINRVILITDGWGSDSEAEMMKSAKDYIAKGGEISTIGIGSYNYELLKKLSESSKGGFVRSASSKDSLKIVFNDEVNSLLSQVATNVSINVTYPANIECANVFAKDYHIENNSVTVNLNAVYSGFSQLTWLRFKSKSEMKKGELIPVKIRLSYFDVLTKKQIVKESEQVIEFNPKDDKYTESNPEVDKVILMMMAQEALQKAWVLIYNKKYADASLILNPVNEVLKQYPIGNDKQIEDMRKLFEFLQTLGNEKKK